MTEPHRLTVRIYYEDTDFSGVVYHANYLRFLERGRTEMLRDAGVSQAGMVDEDGMPSGFMVRRMAIEFVKPAVMDDLIVVATRVARFGGASLALSQSIFRDAELLIRAEVKLALVGGRRVRRLPAHLAARLRSDTSS